MAQTYESFGKYILLEKLATGGMAEVFLARAPGAGGIGKFVAIKRILPQFSDNEEFIKMFKEEAKIAVNLSHSNIVSIYEFGVERGQFFLVMDYVEGRNLRQILNKMKKTSASFSIEQILYIIKEVAAGLDHAHRCLDGSTGKPLNITHRDMSPQNIMVSFEGEIKIVDFGIAKAESQLETTRAGTLKGKFGYMSPEQAEGQAVDLRTDIFSLGTVLWELLSGERLFLSNNEMNTLRKIRDGHIPSLHKMNPSIHPEIDRIVQKALAKDRNLRYQTSAALNRDMNRFLNRHFPDFSPHDFSVSIKTLYSDEILETRKRIIEYAKISEVADKTKTEAQIQDKTIVTNTGADPTSTRSRAEIEDITATGTSAPEGFVEATNSGPILDTEQIEYSMTNPTIVSPQIPSMDNERTQVSPPSSVHLQKKVYEENAPPFNRAQYRSRLELPKQRGDSESSPGMKLLAVMAIACGVVGLAFYFFPQKLGIEDLINPGKTKQDAILQGQQSQSSTQPMPAPTRQSTPAENTTKETVADPAAIPVVINSEPSGAEIYINGESTGEYTPSRLSLSKGNIYKLTLKKDNYIEYHKQEFAPENLESPNIKATMQKVIVGYLDIDVRPSRFARVYINGKLLKGERLPIPKYAVPAGTHLTIKAENPIDGLSASQTIILQEEQHKAVILNLKKTGN